MLLVCDAWFDIVTAQPGDRWLWIATAIFGELPPTVMTPSSPDVNHQNVIGSDDQRRPARTFTITVSATVLPAGSAAGRGHVHRA